MDAIDKQLTHSCACCGQPLPGPAPHSSRQDFEHFLAHSGWAGHDGETKAMLWKAWQHARSPQLIEELVIQCQGAPGQPPPSALSFTDPDGARVDLGPWQPVDFNRWQLRVPLRPLVRTYVPAHTTTPPEGR